MYVGIYVCGYIKTLGGTDTGAYTGTESTGFPEGTMHTIVSIVII